MMVDGERSVVMERKRIYEAVNTLINSIKRNFKYSKVFENWYYYGQK
ncbi:MAG: hypothetical protein F6K24_01890 [Okeania sp. SIO2D1]|nr:hypothetical protein [Okeania sp. SIO2D1]